MHYYCKWEFDPKEVTSTSSVSTQRRCNIVTTLTSRHRCYNVKTTGHASLHKQTSSDKILNMTVTLKILLQCDKNVEELMGGLQGFNKRTNIHVKGWKEIGKEFNANNLPTLSVYIKSLLCGQSLI